MDLGPLGLPKDSARLSDRLLLPRVLHRGFGLVALVMMTLSVMSSGRPFLWCTSMERVMAHCCCPSAESDDGHPTVARTDCCESKDAPKLTDASTIRSQELRPHALVLFVPLAYAATFIEAPRPTTVPAVRIRGARAGPSLGLYDVHRAYLI